MTDWRYEKGLHELGNGLYAYLQPDGSWGWSNAGLVVDGSESLLVDTLFDLKLTGEMLAEMRRATPAAADIGQLVNTHANGDHCFGNQLVAGAEIIASKAAAAEMAEMGPERLTQMMAAAPNMGEVGEYLTTIFGAFEFEGIELTPPTRTFEGETTLEVGDKQVRLIEVGPAHTKGDILVHLPADRVVFTGDILFIEGHPIIWVGPVENWLRACDRILEMDAQVIVPGHGPLTDNDGVRALQTYLEYIAREARARFDAGMPADQAARDIALDAYASWSDAERIVVNVDTLYRQFRGEAAGPTDIAGLLTEMGKLARELGLHGLAPPS